MTYFATLAAALAVTLGSIAGAAAVGTSPDTLELDPDFRDARAHIDGARYEKAIPILMRLRAARPNLPDLPNWIAYSHRKLKDYPTSKRFYDEALAINADFLPALEYQGEWFIETGDMASAKANLARLAALCGRCHEWEDLDQAIRKAEGR